MMQQDRYHDQYAPGQEYHTSYDQHPMQMQMVTLPTSPMPMRMVPAPMPAVAYSAPQMVPYVPAPPPPRQAQKKQGNSCRSICLTISGVVILICGVIIMALPYYAAQLPEKAIRKACGLQRSGCKSGIAALDVSKVKDYTYDPICIVDMKISWGCECDSKTTSCTKPEDFDCSNAPGTTYYLAMLYDWWDTGMWALGGAGLGICIVFVALPAFMGAVSDSCAVVAFSVCSGLWCAPFLFVGACFATVAAAFSVEDLAVSDTNEAMCTSVPAGSSCGTVVWCKALEELINGEEYQITATAACAAVAFFIAGLTMLIGMFVCCCCKAPSEPGKPVQPQPVYMKTPQPTFTAPQPQPAMIMYEPAHREPIYTEPMYHEQHVRYEHPELMMGQEQLVHPVGMPVEYSYAPEMSYQAPNGQFAPGQYNSGYEYR